MGKIIGNTTATPNPRPDWLQNDEKKADYIKNKPDVVTWSDVDSEIDFDSTNPIQNNTVAWRFNEFNQSLKDYADGQNIKQDEKLDELATLVTETMKSTTIDETSTDDQYPTAKAVYEENQLLTEYIDNQNDIQDKNLDELTTLVTETMKATTVDSSSTNNQYPTAKATYDFVKAETASLVESAPEALDTLNELAAALGDDPNFATTVATQIGKKADQEDFDVLDGTVDEHINNKNNPHEVKLTQLGVNATATELNYTKGVTSDIQEQLNNKSPSGHTHNAATTANPGFMSNSDKKKLDGIATGANAYTHPTTSGNKHIPSGGSSGQILKWSTDGTAVWGEAYDGVAASAETLEGLTATIDELNYTDGVTSNIQTQLNGKAASSHTHNYAGSSSAGGAATTALTCTGNAASSTYGKRLYTPSIATTAGTTYTIDTYLTLIKNTLPLETQGYYTWKHSWSYAGNGLLSATIGSTTHKIQLAGAHCEFNGSSSGEYVLRITTATASGTSGASFTAGATYQYNYHGATYSPIWTIDNAIVGLSVNGKTITYTKNNGTTGTITTQDTNTTYDAATQSANGLMSAADKKKLDGIATGANAYTHPAYTARTGVPAANATPGFGGTFSVTQPTSDATGHVTGMNSRTITIPSTVASQSVNGLMTAADKKKLDGIATGANAYSHPTTSGNKHIPSGGADTQILTWSADGTAKWVDHTQMHFMDTRDANTPPSNVPVGLSLHLKNDGATGIWDGGSFQPTLMLKPYWDKSGGPFGQIALTGNNNLWFRTSHINSDTEWKAWRRVATVEDLVGKFTKNLLWENPDASTDFAAQFIPLEASNYYEFLMINFRWWKTEWNSIVHIGRCWETTKVSAVTWNGSIPVALERNFYFGSNGGVNVSDCLVNGVASNGNIIPWKIYGIC